MFALPSRLAALAAALLAVIFVQSGVLAQQLADDDDDDDGPPAALAPAAGPPPNLPSQELTGETLYEYLMGEIASGRTAIQLRRRRCRP
jgi:hypothetical protein